LGKRASLGRAVLELGATPQLHCFKNRALEPILRFLNLQLQRQRCCRLHREFLEEKKCL
jgi:hypothetical protein